MAPNSHVVIGVIVAHEVKVLDEGLEVVPDRGEEMVGDPLLRAELPHYGLDFGKVVVVHAREEVVLNVVVDAAIDPPGDGTAAAGGGRHLLVQEVLPFGVPLLHGV